MSAAVTPSIPGCTDRCWGAEQQFGIPKMHLHVSHKNCVPRKRQVHSEELDSRLWIIPCISLCTWVFPSFPEEMYLAVTDTEMLLASAGKF